jgi:hypothetical protein
MRYFIYIIIAFSALSCNKFLDKKNDNSFLIPKELSDLQLLLQNYATMNLTTTPEIMEFTDDVWIDSNTFILMAPRVFPEGYLWNLKGDPDYNYERGNSWSKPYQAIYVANLCLEKVDKVTPTPSNSKEWNRVKGASLFFRAYHMTNLCWAFAKNYDENNETDLGIVLKLKNDFNVPSVRSTVKESYAQILKDAKESLEYLAPMSESVFLPAKKAAYGLLSRVYLSMLKYDSAFHYANLFLQEHDALINFNNPAEINIHAFQPIVDFCNEVAFVSTSGGYKLTSETIGVDTVFYNSYLSGDLRKIAYFRSVYTGGHSITGFKLNVFTQQGTFTGISTPEMLLTRAECYARKNKLPEALTDLNRLRQSRYNVNTYTPVTSQDQQIVFDTILNERRKELVFRGLRWMDIKRLNKEFSNIHINHYDYINKRFVTLQPNDERYACPIPFDIIMLTGMPQN